MENMLEKLRPFFKERTDFTELSDPQEILKLSVTDLEVIPDDLHDYFRELQIQTVEDLAQYQGEIELEAFSRETTELWLMYAEMIMYYINQASKSKDKKILFVGLENAGKTSIITLLQEKYSYIKTLMPTKGVSRKEIDIFGYSVFSWDAGGQEEYRKNYLEKPEVYFEGTDLLIYCIDIQDKTKHQATVEYYGKILDALRSIDLKVPILVVFTKFDPDVQKDQEAQSARLLLMEQIHEMTADEIDLAFCVSSIFERNSIEEVFSMALRRLSTTNVVIEAMLKIFMKNIRAEAVCLANEHGLIYGSCGLSAEVEDLIIQTGAYLQTLNNYHEKAGLLAEPHYLLKYSRNNLYFVCERVLVTDHLLVNLWVLTENLRDEVVAIPHFKDNLIPLIELYL